MLLLFVRICCLICRKLSASHCRTLGRFLGWIWYRILPIRRSVVRLQMARAYPEWAPKMVEEHVRRMYLHWGESFVEFMRYGGLHGLPSPPLKLEGEAFMREALSLGRGVLVLTAHIGNFELTLRAAAQSGLPLTVVTKTMHSLTAERVWRYLRSGPGDALVKFCPTKGCAREVLRDLASGGMVAYVFDQHASGRHATEVGFFGQPAETSTDLARLQRLTGAPIVPVFGYRVDDEHHVRIEAPIWAADASSLEQVTARCTAEIERAVRAHPEQWLWLHRRWKRSKQAKKMNCDPKELQKLERRHIKTSFFAVLLQTLLLSAVCALCGFVLDLPEVMKWGPLVCLLGVVALELRERAGDRLWLEPARTLLRVLCQSDALSQVVVDWRQGLPYLRAEWQQFQVVVHFENAPLAHRLRLNVTLGFETRVPLKLFSRDAADLPQKALEKLTRRGEWQAIPCDDALLAYSPDSEAAQRLLSDESAVRLLKAACCDEQGALEFCGDAVIWDRLLPPSPHALGSENLFKIWGLLREMAEIAASVWGDDDQLPDDASGEATLDQVETKQAPPPGASST